MFTAALASCSDGSDRPTQSEDEQASASDDFKVDSALFRENVGSGLEACQGLHAACESDGRGDGPSEACRSEMKSCFSAVIEQAKQLFRALHACRESALECVQDDGDRETCRDEFRACVRSAFSGDGGVGADGGSDAGIDWSDDDGPRGPRLDGGSRRPPRTPDGDGDDSLSPSDGDDPRSGGSSTPLTPGSSGTTPPRGGTSLTPVPALDGGVSSDSPIREPVGGAASDDCIAKVQACAATFQSNPEACSAAASTCLGSTVRN